ncbi:MAG: hypothetical protein DRP64_13820 [Verrucomicrobia bacterium]|nr:MAG: hypothetical protein DRP64_13820 [Verrucomicrobiota bacterium]
MKKKKALKIVLLSLASLVLVLVLVVLFWLGPTVKVIVKMIGQKALGTPVAIEKLSINPRKGILHLSGFSIANPESFGESNAVSLASMDIAIDMGSIFSKTVMVHQVRINSPHFTFEQSSASDNIAEYIRSIEDFIGYDPNVPPEPKEKKKKKEKAEKTPKVVIVQSLEINDLQFHMVHTEGSHLDIAVGLEQLAVSMTNGIVQLKNIYVKNPGRLASKDVFTLDNIHVQIDPTSIYQAPLSILDVQMHNPRFFVEWASDASTVSEFLSIANATQARVLEWPLPKKIPEAEQEQDAEIEPSAEVKPPPPPPEIHHLGIANFQFHLVNSIDPSLGIQVLLENMEVGLLDGTVKLGRFSITNPRRLATPDLFSLDGIDVRFDPTTLHSPPFSILDVQVRKPYAFLENNPETDTVAEFMKIAETIVGNLPTNTVSAKESEEPETQPEPDTPGPPPFELHNLLVNDIQIKMLDSTPTNAPSEPAMLAGISSISVKWVDGSIQVKGITVPNPAGFHATNLFHLAEIVVALDPESIFSERVVVNEVLVDSPEINLEQTETSGNVATLQESLMAFVPPTPETPASEPEKLPETVATNAPVPLAEQPVILETLIVTNLAVNAILLPPGTTTTNEPATGLLDRVGLNKLNPITYVKKTGTNEMAAAEASEIALLAFDLLSIEPLKGTVGISNLRIGNPQGFANEHLVKLQQFKLCLDPDSLLTDTLLIKEIHIEKPRVAYERKITTDNIKTFQQTIEGAVAQREEAMDKAEEQHDVEADVEQKVIIEHLLVQNGIVRAKISALPTAPIPLPTIEMKDVGKKEGGASLGEASSKIFSAFYDSIIGVVANTTGIAGDALKGAGSLTLDTLGNITESIGGLVGKDGKVKTETPEESEPKKKKPRSKRRRIFRR